MAFYDHLGTNENICLSSRKSRQNLLVSALFGCSIQIHTQDPGFREHFRSHFFYFLGSCAKRGNIRRAAGRTGLRLTDGITTVMAHQPSVGAVIGHRHAAAGTLRHAAALAAKQHPAVAAAIQKQNTLLAAVKVFFEFCAQRCADNPAVATAQLFLHVGKHHFRQGFSIITLPQFDTAIQALLGGIGLGALVAAAIVGWLASSSIHIVLGWEKAVVLRLGKFSRTKGPGLYFTIPFIDQIALSADQRVMVTGFGAEATLTSDLVPINVDAVLFWMVWDAEKAALEVENYYNSVNLAAQTALRDAIGRASASEVAVRRNQLDEELQEVIEDKTSQWGITVLSVEIRDIVIPESLQEVMSAEAQAEREKNARMVLAEVEKDISSMLVEAADQYKENEVALRLRTMHLLYESVKNTGGTVVIPSAYSEGFSDSTLDALTESLKKR